MVSDDWRNTATLIWDPVSGNCLSKAAGSGFWGKKWHDIEDKRLASQDEEYDDLGDISMFTPPYAPPHGVKISMKVRGINLQWYAECEVTAESATPIEWLQAVGLDNGEVRFITAFNGVHLIKED